jgi:hypothetical protein
MKNIIFEFQPAEYEMNDMNSLIEQTYPELQKAVLAYSSVSNPQQTPIKNK